MLTTENWWVKNRVVVVYVIFTNSSYLFVSSVCDSTVNVTSLRALSNVFY